MATNQLKIALEIDLDSFQGIDRFYVATLTDCIQNHHLNLHMQAPLCWGFKKEDRKRNR
jgi:hypothetical protein